ncbi:16S rRNA (guanine1207-N2)-methyltransferase [Microlunatus sagamiharensis]|uniref:16S rRNA (Guanine1207-N2)-methyltransferase n=1 Tax=Microlunatus sagamiharensis TaxID=546874 RepID=A0A1H2N272_9ACTN|nr:class I SAM-dependent methyltransferase [Microlunatus sagamiharensis]SDU99540.1 16S rRNA (guanine1207-N2)-methyltransferase [Microlunatus sagamiharensis]
MSPDGVDRLLLAEAEAYAGRPTAVLDDVSGALVGGLGGSSEVRAWCSDSLVDERTAAAETSLEPGGWLDPTVLAGARLVVTRLPKSLAALDELAGAVAAHAEPDVVLLAGGLVRHLNRSMNEVLADHFGEVRASLGRHKARALVASGPRAGAGRPWPREEHDDAEDLTVAAYGGVFAGTGVDVGTRVLLGVLDRLPAGATEVVDLGSGNGSLTAAVARALPRARVRGFDVSAAAVRSTLATAAANGLGDRVEAVRGDGLEGVAAGSLDLVVCNPPFHRGTALDRTTTPGLFADVGRALRPGGELWTVWNSHLPYLPMLRARVGSTSVVTQTPRFTVTRSRRPA